MKGKTITFNTTAWWQIMTLKKKKLHNEKINGIVKYLHSLMYLIEVPCIFSRYLCLQ